MLQVILVLVSIAGGLFRYLFRWNMTNPNKLATIKVDGLERTVLYHVPKKLKPTPRLVLAFHGSNINGKIMQVFTGHEFDEFADQEQNTIVAYPNGYKRNWNDCRKNASFPGKVENIDDVKFTEEIINYFINNYNIDTNNVFAVGFSNGGQFVFRLAHEKPNIFKAFATICAQLPTPDNNICSANSQDPVNILLSYNQEDPLIPYNGGEIILDKKSLGNVISAEGTTNRFVEANRAGLKDTSGISKTGLVRSYYSELTNRKVTFISLSKGGHTIANKNFRIPLLKMGKINGDVDLPKLIWDFWEDINIQP